jgi:phosphinothricin acetyltransferase
MTTSETATIVRYAAPEDLPALTAIYNHYVVNTATTFDIEPLAVEQRAEWFSHYASSGRHRLLVAERDGEVAGYCSTSQFRTKRAYDTTVEMTVLCAPQWIGHRIGHALYNRIFDELRGEDIHAFIASITLPNRGSIELHERFGFTSTATFHDVGRKFGRYHDVVWMERIEP